MRYEDNTVHISITEPHETKINSVSQVLVWVYYQTNSEATKCMYMHI